MGTVLRDLVAFVVLSGVIGILAHVLGEALPRAAFDHTKFPYAPYAWERSGRIYNRLHIERWKNKLPDKSRHVRSTIEKSIRGDCTPEHFLRLIRETCVAEFVHWALLLISPLLLLALHSPAGVAATIVYGLSNLPFIMIQRYNRPRLVRMYTRVSGGRAVASATDSVSKGGAGNAAADPVLQ